MYIHKLSYSLRKPIRAIPSWPIFPSFRPTILLYYHSSILPSFHPAFVMCSYMYLLSLMESPALYRGVGRDDLIKLYFYEGYNYRLIICFLFFVHGISLSLRHLKRRLQGMNLRRRMYPTSHGIISLLIQVYYNYY